MNPIVNTILAPILSIIDKAVPDRAEATRLKSEIEQTVLQNESKMLDAMSSVAQSDSKSESWLTRNARPLVVFNMLAFLNIFIVTMLFDSDLATQMAEAMATVPNMVWAMIAGGVGLYPIMRGVEKIKGVAGHR